MTKLGVYAGNPPEVDSFGAWLGHPVDVAEFFVEPWHQIPQWYGRPQQLVVSSNMVIPLWQGAANAFDAHYVGLAQHLVSIGHGNAIIRLGWEFNANWMPWRAAADPLSFKRYWKNVVRAMRTVPGQAFKFDWCVWCNRAELPDPAVVYPGDEFVDYIGVDLYDTVPGVNGWKPKANGTQGLDYWAAFAAAHGKRVSIPEWGLSPSGGDDVYFVEKLKIWISNHDVAYHSYFNEDATAYGIGDHRLAPNAVHSAPSPYPNAAARYRALFG